MKAAQLSLSVSLVNEGTRAPWWMILDPQGSRRGDVGGLAAQIRGPFFSREEAQEHLDAIRHKVGPDALVWCDSGHESAQYARAYELAKNGGEA